MIANYLSERTPRRAFASPAAAFALATLAACSSGSAPGAAPSPAGRPPIPPIRTDAIPRVVDAARAAAAAKGAFPPGWRFDPGTDATFAEHAMVVSVSRPASEAGVEIMKAGGNAVDAAVATGFALAVTSSSNGNIGGGGFMTIRMADGRMATLDYREIAPAAATRDMYLGADGKLTNKSTVGYLASGVPGSVAGLAEALSKYGSMPLARVMAPAIRLASDGYLIDRDTTRGAGTCNR